MSQQNVELLRSIFAGWERGEFAGSEWAHPEIEYVEVGGPQPGEWEGVGQMKAAWAAFLRAWDEFRIEAEQYQVLDDERVLVLVRPSGRGRSSGLDIQEMHAAGAVMFTVREGVVTRFVIYWDRESAYADLAPTNVELVQAVNAAFAAEGDAVALFRDEERVDRLFTAGMPLFREDFETVVPGVARRGEDVSGLRRAAELLEGLARAMGRISAGTVEDRRPRRARPGALSRLRAAQGQHA